MFFHPKNLKSENKNTWFKQWFNILQHTQSIVCATINSHCLEYLGYITLAKKCLFLHKVTYIKVQTIYLTRLISNIMSLNCVDKSTDFTWFFGSLISNIRQKSGTALTLVAKMAKSQCAVIWNMRLFPDNSTFYFRKLFDQYLKQFIRAMKYKNHFWNRIF